MKKAGIKEYRRRIWVEKWNNFFKNIHEKEVLRIIEKKKKKDEKEKK